MRPRAARGSAFAVGFGLALVPAIGPFLAVLVFISSRLRMVGRDAIWLASAILLCVGPLLTGRLEMIPPVALQVLAGWMVYRAFGELRTLSAGGRRNRSIEWGMLAGLTFLVAINLANVEQWNFAAAKTIANAIVWGAPPALFGHSVLTIGGLVAILSRTPQVRIGALGLAAIGILLSGSREAAIGWLLVSVVVVLTGQRRQLRTRAVELALVMLMSLVAAGMAPLIGWGNVGFLVQSVETDRSTNLLQGTELPHGDWWDASWVSVDTFPVDVSGQALTAYLVRKRGHEGWLRLQQSVELQPSTLYSVSAWIRHDDLTTVPGIQGWGQYRHRRGVSTFAIVGELTRQWSVGVSGPGVLVDSGVAESSGDWQRVYASFRYEGEEPLDWFVGLAPDASGSHGAETAFAGFQLERGPLSDYVPGEATRGLPLGAARIPAWKAAWHGIQQSPLLGRGEDAFSRDFLELWPDRGRLHVIPAHAHNAFLSTWLQRGILGLLGLLLLLAGIAGPALSRGDIPLLAVILAIVFVNMFDNTLLYGGVFYPLVAIAGWRAQSHAERSSAAEGLTRQVSTRLVLVTADAVAALSSFAAAISTAAVVWPILGAEFSRPTLPAAAAYGLLLWPALSWREGLHPGYGLTAPQELKRQVTVCAYAGLLLGGAFAFVGLPSATSGALWALAIAYSFVALPIGRAVAKRFLLHLDLWGRPVIILGAGEMGVRVARALQRSPLDGLHPVAFFDNSQSLQGKSLQALPVRGTLGEAERFAVRRGITHVIVALPSLGGSEASRVIDHDSKQFRTVQYIPDLGGMSADNVAAANLDGMLAIEVRNNLALRRNRIAKRAIDLVCTVVGGLLISGIVLALAIAIRLDSRGPVFFGHWRVGENGRPFRTWKFRTMVTGAEEVLEKHLAAHPDLKREWQDSQKLQDDPRVTRVGRFLRKTSLDELPQLANVLLGQMSLVGPRPIIEAEIEKYADAFDLYASVKPGITGQWQVSGRSNTSYRERVELDSYYVRNWSVWLDIVILVRTVRVVITGSGAY